MYIGNNPLRMILVHFLVEKPPMFSCAPCRFHTSQFLLLILATVYVVVGSSQLGSAKTSLVRLRTSKRLIIRHPCGFDGSNEPLHEFLQTIRRCISFCVCRGVS